MANSWTLATVKLFGAASLLTLVMTLLCPQNFGFARTTYESRIYDFCERRYKYIRNNLHQAPSVVVTGQPGLGKYFSS